MFITNLNLYKYVFYLDVVMSDMEFEKRSDGSELAKTLLKHNKNDRDVLILPTEDTSNYS